MTEETLNKIIGKNIKKYRLLYNVNKGTLTQKDLAEKVGVSSSLIGGLESNKVNQGVSIYNLYKISEILNVKVDEFFK